MEARKEALTIKEMNYNEKVAKVSIVGAGMLSNPGVAATMFESLSNSNININMISTSEIRITVLIDEKRCRPNALVAIHDIWSGRLIKRMWSQMYRMAHLKEKRIGKFLNPFLTQCTVMIFAGKGDILTKPVRRGKGICLFFGRKFDFGKGEEGEITGEDIKLDREMIFVRDAVAFFCDNAPVCLFRADGSRLPR